MRSFFPHPGHSHAHYSHAQAPTGTAAEALPDIAELLRSLHPNTNTAMTPQPIKIMKIKMLTLVLQYFAFDHELACASQDPPADAGQRFDSESESESDGDGEATAAQGGLLDKDMALLIAMRVSPR